MGRNRQSTKNLYQHRKPKLSSLFTCFSAAISSCSHLFPPSHVMMMSPVEKYILFHRTRLVLSGKDNIPRNWDESTSLLLSLNWQLRGMDCNLGGLQLREENHEPNSPRVSCIGQVQINKPSLLEDHNQTSINKQKRWEKFVCSAGSSSPYSLELLDVDVRKDAQRSNLPAATEKASANSMASHSNSCEQYKVIAQQGQINDPATESTSRVCGCGSATKTAKSEVRKGECVQLNLDENSRHFSFAINRNFGTADQEQHARQQYAFLSIPPVDYNNIDDAHNSNKRSAEVSIWKRRCFNEPVRLNLRLEAR